MIKNIFKNKTFAQFSLVFTTAIWGITFIMVKEALNDAPLFAFSTLRFSIALFCTLIPIIYQFKKFSKQEIYGGILCGILLHAGYAFQNYGLQLTSASKSAFITGTSILIVPFILWIFNNKKITLKNMAIYFYSNNRAFLLINPTGNNINIGDVITIGCSISFAGHIIVQDLYTKSHLSILRLFFYTISNRNYFIIFKLHCN